MGEQFLFPLSAKHEPNDTDSGEGIKGDEIYISFFCRYCGFCTEASGICQLQALIRASKIVENKSQSMTTSLTMENPWKGYPGTLKAVKRL